MNIEQKEVNVEQKVESTHIKLRTTKTCLYIFFNMHEVLIFFKKDSFVWTRSDHNSYPFSK